MKAIDYIKMSLEMSKGWIMGLAADIKDEPFVQPTPKGGNHPMWCVGHLVYSEANLVNVFIKGEPNPVEEWADIFGQGTDPTDDESKYPPIEEVLAKFEEIRGGTMAFLDTLTDADLDNPTKAPGEMKNWFGSYAQCLAAIPVHYGFHGGQIADARRAAGRDVMMG